MVGEQVFAFRDARPEGIIWPCDLPAKAARQIFALLSPPRCTSMGPCRLECYRTRSQAGATHCRHLAIVKGNTVKGLTLVFGLGLARAQMEAIMSKRRTSCKDIGTKRCGHSQAAEASAAPAACRASASRSARAFRLGQGDLRLGGRAGIPADAAFNASVCAAYYTCLLQGVSGLGFGVQGSGRNAPHPNNSGKPFNVRQDHFCKAAYTYHRKPSNLWFPSFGPPGFSILWYC